MNIYEATDLLTRRLDQIKKEHAGDTEQMHYYADEALVNFLRDIGAKRAADSYDAIPKWFS